jgi:hypothetical protein
MLRERIRAIATGRHRQLVALLGTQPLKLGELGGETGSQPVLRLASKLRAHDGCHELVSPIDMLWLPRSEPDQLGQMLPCGRDCPDLLGRRHMYKLTRADVHLKTLDGLFEEFQQMWEQSERLERGALRG